MESGPNLTDGSRESDDPNAARSGAAAGDRAGVDRGSGGVDVVDHTHLRGELGAGLDTPANVAAPGVERQPALAGQCVSPDEHVAQRKAPDDRKLARERSGGNIATPPGPVRVARDRNKALDRRLEDHLRDERRRFMRKPASRTLLPGP